MLCEDLISFYIESVSKDPLTMLSEDSLYTRAQLEHFHVTPTKVNLKCLLAPLGLIFASIYFK